MTLSNPKARDDTERPALRLVGGSETDAPGDDELVAAHLAGSPAAFNVLVRRYQRPIYRLALRYARDVDEAEELAQRTFMQAFVHVQRLQGPTHFRAFLFRVAANLCKNHIRDRAKLVFGIPLQAAAPEEMGLEERQRRERMREMLARLPLRQRQVVSLRIDGDLPFADVARALNITENNAKVCFHHALKKLRALLSSEDL